MHNQLIMKRLRAGITLFTLLLAFGFILTTSRPGEGSKCPISNEEYAVYRAFLKSKEFDEIYLAPGEPGVLKEIPSVLIVSPIYGLRWNFEEFFCGTIGSVEQEVEGDIRRLFSANPDSGPLLTNQIVQDLTKKRYSSSRIDLMQLKANNNAITLIDDESVYGNRGCGFGPFVFLSRVGFDGSTNNAVFYVVIYSAPLNARSYSFYFKKDKSKLWEYSNKVLRGIS